MSIWSKPLRLAAGEAETALIPPMTGPTAPAGVAAASSYFSTNFEAFRAFNGVQATLATMQQGWLAATSDNAPWLSYRFAAPARLRRLWIETANNGPEGVRSVAVEGLRGGEWENCLASGDSLTLRFVRGAYTEFTAPLNGGRYEALRIRGGERFFVLSSTACTFSRVQVYGSV